MIAVNKIDLVDYSQRRFDEVVTEVNALAAELGIEDIWTLPVSALVGDNVVARSPRLSWFAGPSLLELLEQLPADDPATIVTPTGLAERPLRFPVQLTIRPQAAAVADGYAEYRAYAGQIASGVVRLGDQVVVLPSGRRTTVTGIDTAAGALAEAFAPQSVSLRLADEIDITRGELIAGTELAPTPTQQLDGMVVWLHERVLREGQRVLVKHTTRTVAGIVDAIDGRLDLDTLRPEATQTLELNDIGRVQLRLAAPIMAENYARSRQCGSFLLIDPASGANLAAGMVRGDQAFSAEATIRHYETDSWAI